MLFGEESNAVVFTGILIVLFKESTLEPAVWAMPVCLNTLITLSLSITSNTLTVSTSVTFPDPILIEPPIATLVGIFFTWISWIKPLLDPIVIGFESFCLSVLTPILKESVKFTTEVLKPDILTDDWLLNSINGKNCPTTSL